MTKKITSIFILLLATSKVWCQIIITGQVVFSSDKSPVPGASIAEKSTSNGTQSNMDGAFSITVSDGNATLVISSIGYITKEYRLKGANNILVKMKYDCYNDFFDVNKIGIYANSGVLNTPVGGQLYVTLPVTYGAGSLNSSFGFQSNLKNNQFLNAQTEFRHFALTCDFSMNARWHYREVSYNDHFQMKAYTFETDLNFDLRSWFFPYLSLTVGYGNLNIKSDNQSATGPIIGVSTSLGRSIYVIITGKVGIFKNKIELQGKINRDFKNFNIFIKYYQLQPFSELSLGIGKEFGYRLKNLQLKK